MLSFVLPPQSPQYLPFWTVLSWQSIALLTRLSQVLRLRRPFSLSFEVGGGGSFPWNLPPRGPHQSRCELARRAWSLRLAQRPHCHRRGVRSHAALRSSCSLTMR